MASLTLDIPEDDSFIPIALRPTDNLPAHIKGTAAWHQGHSQNNPFTYWVSINNRDTPVEFINNRWFILQVYCGQYHTKQSLIIALKNSLNLHVYPDPIQIQDLPARTTLCASFGFDPNASSSSSSRESTATQQSFSDAQEVPTLHINTTIISQGSALS